MFCNQRSGLRAISFTERAPNGTTVGAESEGDADDRPRTRGPARRTGAGGAAPAPPRDPLWLPRGSVRSLIALGLVGVWASLETGLLGGQPGAAPDVVRLLAISVAAGYGLLRRHEVAHPPEDIRSIIRGEQRRGEGDDRP